MIHCLESRNLDTKLMRKIGMSLSEYYKNSRLFTVICLTLYFVFTIPIAFLQPTEGYNMPPDEMARYLLPSEMFRTGCLPTGLEPQVQVPGYGGSYMFQPYFPYICMAVLMRIAALLTGITDTRLLLPVCRCFNVFIGFICLMLVIRLSEELFDKKWKQYLYAVVVIFLPEHLFLYTYVNTEAMCLLGIFMQLLFIIQIYQRGITPVRAILYAVGASLTTLSYFNGYGYMIASVLLFFGSQWGNENLKKKWTKIIEWGILIISVWLLLSGWYFLRNYRLYDGDLFGLKTQAAHRIYPEPSPYKQGIGLIQLLKERHTLSIMFNSSIAVFGSSFIDGPIWLYRGYKIVLTIGVLGFLGRLFYNKDGLIISRKRVYLGLCFIVAWAINVGIWLYYAYFVEHQRQGRYIVPGWPALAFFFCVGFSFWVELINNNKKQQMIATLIGAGWIALCFWYLVGYALPAY